MRLRYILALLLASASPLAHAQAIPAGSVPGDLQVGFVYAHANPDYGPKNTNGFGVFADVDLWKYIGVEGEFHRITGNTPIAVTESTYEIGGRYRYPFHAFSPYIKVLAGGGLFSFGDSSQSGTYAMYAGGGGIDYQATQHVILRADYEYQRWGSFPPHGLQPNVFTIGAAYRFH